MTRKQNIWYRSFSTGIAEIDNQHSEIDSALADFINTAGNEEETLPKFLELIKNHLASEEELLQEKFPAEHAEEHRSFAEELTLYAKSFENGQFRKEVLFDTIRMKLIEHVQRFDCKLKQHL